jgi:HEPN domain-containing protein
VGLAIESLLMAMLAKNGIYPEHSSIGSMLREIKKLAPVPEEFFAEVRFMNSLMNFCSLEVVAERIPTDEEIERMITFVGSLRDWASSNLKAA